VVLAFALLGLILGGGFGAAAQDGTPEPEDEGETVAHPAHVHTGTCDDLDPNPTFPLDDVAAPADAETEGAETAVPVETSVTTIDVALADLLADDYAINVHESAENAGNYIACGDIGGAVTEGDDGEELAVGLREENGSGYAGIAWLQESVDGGTTVTIFLARELTEAGGGTPAADAEEMTINIVDFFFDPAEVTVKVGTTVTWVNVGPTDHTTTAFVDGDKFWDSEIMHEGDTFSFTFDEPGSFDYLCGLHPNMKAHLEVVE
jgi:plastocyanin